jgi:hypothetical protein
VGSGEWGLGPTPNPQSPFPNPQSPIPIEIFLNLNFRIEIYFYNIAKKFDLYI